MTFTDPRSTGSQPALRPVLLVSVPPPRVVDLTAEPPPDELPLTASDHAAFDALDEAWWAECERLLALEDDPRDRAAAADVSAEELRRQRAAADVPLAAPGVQHGPVRSALASRLDALETVLADVRSEAPSGSLADLERMLRLTEQARALGLRELAEMDALGTHTTPTGPRSTTAMWLSRTLHLSDTHARATARLARELTHTLPVLGNAVADGHVSIEHARAATDAVRGLDPDVVRDSQNDLITLAQHLDPVSLRALLRDRAVAVNDALAADAERRARERAQFTLSPVGDRYASRGSHTAEHGALIRNALDHAIATLKDQGDTRPAAALREQVLYDWASSSLQDLAGADSQANDARTTRTHLLIGTTIEQLQQTTGTTDSTVGSGDTGDTPTPAGTLPLTFTDAMAELAGGYQQAGQPPTTTGARLLDNDHVLSHNALRRLACDALITLVLTPGPDGRPLLPDPLTSHLPRLTEPPHDQPGPTSPTDRLNPLWVGRTSRTISGPMFKALAYRDRTCVVRGCHRPPAHCEGHHVRHWTDGGPTDLDNLVLLCPQHHHDLHDRGVDLPHRDGHRWITQTGWAWLTDHGWTDTDPALT